MQPIHIGCINGCNISLLIGAISNASGSLIGFEFKSRSRHDFDYLTPSQSTHYTQECAALPVKSGQAVRVSNPTRTILLFSDERKLSVHFEKRTPSV
jgi:hypothetical protein